MTLNNIFFGKKVVQQAYLNNALIYQSKGWETLPSTCTEVWTKDYDISSSLGELVSDLDNNLYGLNINSLYKFDSNGSILWQKKLEEFKKSDEHNCSFYYLKFNNDLFFAKGNDNSKWFIYELDRDGLIKNEYSIYDIYPCSWSKISSFVIDDKYIYVSGYTINGNYEIYNNYLLKIDRITKKLVQKTTVFIANNTLISVDKYLYAEESRAFNTGVLRRFDKDDISNSSIIDDLNNADIDNHITSITSDELGNIIYKTRNNGTYKYSTKDKTKIKLPIYISNENNSMCVDYQQNLYVIEYISPSKTTNLLKISSDNTLIYKIPIKDATSPILTVDYQGNIYYKWDTSDQNHIKKLINIEKKGN